jgi:hypothetical protein
MNTTNGIPMKNRKTARAHAVMTEKIQKRECVAPYNGEKLDNASQPTKTVATY